MDSFLSFLQSTLTNHHMHEQLKKQGTDPSSNGQGPTEDQARILRFAGFELDLDTDELSRDGELLPLAPQPSRVLAFLAANPGRTVTREEIQRHVWSDEHVEADLGLNSCIKKIRAQLGDDPRSPRFIRTVPRRGYRFVAPVEQPGSSREHHTAVEPSHPRLRLVVAVGAVLILATAIVLQVRRDPLPDLESAERLSLAVLGFENLGADASLDYLGLGLTEETITRLGRIDPEKLAVIARGTVAQLAGSGKSVQEIADELTVRYLVEGSVQREKDRLRATVRLVDSENGTQLAAETYEISTRNVLTAQGALADRISSWVITELLPRHDLPAIAPEPTVDPALYETYLIGLHRLHAGTPEAYSEARERFQQVVAKEPGYALGWAGLAEAELWLRWFGSDDPEAAQQRSREASERAIALDPRLAAPHLMLGYAALYVDYDLEEAGRQLAAAVAKEPGSARAQAWYAALLSALGRHEEAIERATLARRLDPLTMAVRADLCWLLNYARRFEAALDACTHALELQPGDVWTTLGKVEALRHLGQPGDAVAILATLASSKGSDEQTTPWTAGETAEATLSSAWIWLDAAFSKRPQPIAVASTAALLGQTERAIENLELAWQTRSTLLVFIGVDPRFDSLRENPAFHDLLDRLGLPQA